MALPMLSRDISSFISRCHSTRSLTTRYFGMKEDRSLNSHMAGLKINKPMARLNGHFHRIARSSTDFVRDSVTLCGCRQLCRFTDGLEKADVSLGFLTYVGYTKLLLVCAEMKDWKNSI